MVLMSSAGEFKVMLAAGAGVVPIGGCSDGSAGGSSSLDSSSELAGDRGGDSLPLRSRQHCWSKGRESGKPLSPGTFL
jgi:hypothetical protein